jgi:hypothetical protein
MRPAFSLYRADQIANGDSLLGPSGGLFARNVPIDAEQGPPHKPLSRNGFAGSRQADDAATTYKMEKELQEEGDDLQKNAAGR